MNVLGGRRLVANQRLGPHSVISKKSFLQRQLGRCLNEDLLR